MRSTFFGMETLRRAMQAQQRALETTGHNIANANTPGYSRQVANMKATSAFPYPSLSKVAGVAQVGTGVEVAEIRRVRDEFLDAQIRQETQALGFWSTRRQMIGQMELIYNEPSENGIASAMDQYWDALQDLGLNPESSAARMVVIERAQALTQLMRHTRTQMEDLRIDIDRQIEAEANRVNSLAHQIASINQQISHVALSGDSPNDLLDRRNELIVELSSMVNLRVETTAKGTLELTVSGVSLVNHNMVNEINVSYDPFDAGGRHLTWSRGGVPVVFQSGSLGALADMRDNFIPSHIQRLDQMAATIIQETNRVHRAGQGLDGSTNRNFFKGTSARDIAVDDLIVMEPKSIAASFLGSEGEGANALAMAHVFRMELMEQGTARIADFFGATVAQLGVEGQKAQRLGENQALLVQHLDLRQQSLSGVSLDEEMANMIQFQHAYSAAARMMTALDEVADLIINRMGVVGR